MVTYLHSWASRFIVVLLNTELMQHKISVITKSAAVGLHYLIKVTDAIIKQCHDADNSRGQEQDVMMTCKAPVQSSHADNAHLQDCTLGVRQPCTPVSLAACLQAARLGSSGHAAAAAQHPVPFPPSCCTVLPADGLCWPAEHSLLWLL